MTVSLKECPKNTLRLEELSTKKEVSYRKTPVKDKSDKGDKIMEGTDL
jgi:hypothetical protein